MPTFSNTLPVQQKHMGFDLRRTPAASALQAVVTCDDILVCNTHFWRGRTLPCEAPDCPACNESIPFRTHVYVSAFDAKTHEHFIFECTANAAKAFADYRSSATTLRGCAFHASRPKCLKNSKVVILTNTVNLSRVTLPEPPNLIRALCVIWRLPSSAMPIESDRHSSPTVKPNRNRLKKLIDQPDNQPEPSLLRDVLSGNGHASKTRVS